MPVKKTDERMRVILSEDVKSTDEVVVVLGQGTQRKISVVGYNDLPRQKILILQPLLLPICLVVVFLVSSLS